MKRRRGNESDKKVARRKERNNYLYTVVDQGKENELDSVELDHVTNNILSITSSILCEAMLNKILEKSI